MKEITRMDDSIKNDDNHAPSMRGIRFPFEFFVWSISIVGILCCGSMLSVAVHRHMWGVLSLWDQGLVVNAVLWLVANTMLALVILRNAKADRKKSMGDECTTVPLKAMDVAMNGMCGVTL